MRNQKDQRAAYIDLFITFSNLVEKWIKRSIAVLIIMLVCMQFLLQFSGIRYHITTIGKLEGTTDQSLNEQ